MKTRSLFMKSPVTRWCEAKAMKGKSAKHVAEFIWNEIFLRQGPPMNLISDRGKEFLNEIVASLCQIQGTKQSITSAYNPRCNGTAERLNRTLLEKLAKLFNGKYNQRDEFLPIALYSYRISPRSRLNVSPFELLYERKPYHS
ncbi:hypothetical protein ENBRE01_1688 [Enteropsectra breve]|nr:hypothetical protein ENBRE01_1688 [Enteropsectra breve]